MNILRLALTGLFRKKFYTLLLLAVCFAAMQTVLSGITGAAGFFCQQKIFEASVSVELDRVLHLDYQYTEESPEFAGVIRQYLDYIGTRPGVAAVGQFDAEGVYFSELEDLEAYKSVNGVLLKGQKYEDYPGISRLLHADAAMLPFVEGGVTGYADPGNGSLPLYVSEVFREILPIGQTLTEERTGERYEVMGYIPKGAVWVEEDDLIRFPVVSLDGWFLAPFSGESRSDIMTQLSCLHNTYVFLADGADTGLIRETDCRLSPTAWLCGLCPAAVRGIRGLSGGNRGFHHPAGAACWLHYSDGGQLGDSGVCRERPAQKAAVWHLDGLRIFPLSGRRGDPSGAVHGASGGRTACLGSPVARSDAQHRPVPGCASEGPYRLHAAGLYSAGGAHNRNGSPDPAEQAVPHQSRGTDQRRYRYQ